MRIVTERIEDKFAQWFENGDPGDWVGIFENHDLGHPDIGQTFALFFDADQYDKAIVGKSSAPDTATFGIGWRYLLTSKHRDLESTLETWKGE